VALAGCNVFQGPTDRTASLPNATEATDRVDRLDEYRVTQNVTLEHDGTVSWTVQRIASRPETGAFRNEVLATGPASEAGNSSLGVGSLIVSNGSVRYIYAANAETVSISSVSSDDRNRTGDLGRLFAELRDDDNGTIRQPTPGVAPLPVVPAATQSGSDGDNASVSWREEMVTVQYRGTESVAGREAYVVDIRPANENASLVDATLWLDTEYLFPLKRHTVTYRAGDRYEYTVVNRDVTFDPSFRPGTFDPDPDALPGNVSTVRTETYETRAAMTAALDRPIPDPAVPDGFVFETGYYRSGEFDHVSLRYGTPDGRESLRLSLFPDPGNLSDGRQVTIEGRPAAFSTFRDNRYLQWNADGRQYSLTGTVGNETLREVASSLIDG
jgi:outer membrane lipoprotein-sorting protein